MGYLDFLSSQDIENPKGKGLYRIIVEFNIEKYPGDIIRREGDKPTDKEQSDRLYKFAGDSYKFFKNVYKRDGLDNKGRTIVILGNYPPPVNLQWNLRQDQIEVCFEEFVVDATAFRQFFTKQTALKNAYFIQSDCSTFLDLFIHEFTHGIHDFSENVITGFNERGFNEEEENEKNRSFVVKTAIREHLADVFALAGIHYLTGNVTWGIGNGLLRYPESYLFNAPVRTFNDEPSITESAFTMDDFFNSVNGGYINSKILSHSFYIFSTFLGGIYGINSWDVPAKIWFKLLTSSNTSKDFFYSNSFLSFANATLFYCEQLYPQYLDKLKFAWHKTKVLNPFEEDQCKLNILELDYKKAYEQYWLDLNINILKQSKKS